MKHIRQSFFRLALMAIILITWWWVLNVSFSKVLNLVIIVGGVFLTYPLVWFGRKMLDRHQTTGHAVRITTFVHCCLAITFGIPIILALSTHKQWPGWVLPIPSVIGLVLVIITGTACFLSVVNLALRGLGAPFFISLSRKLAADWMYAWTRNPMVLTALALLVSLGIWFRSLFFVVWAIVIFAPALLFFVKVFEERELEIRFGESYKEYKSKTPMLFPKKPGNRIT
jgi:protein-S-isoprenylcysteine O-methyltransferase Ste14